VGVPRQNGWQPAVWATEEEHRGQKATQIRNQTSSDYRENKNGRPG